MENDIEQIMKEAVEIDVGEIWFKVLELPNNVYAIHEPHHWQEVISFLIIGSRRAVLLDTGMGIKDISRVVKQLTDLEVIVVNSHTHFDHVGDNHRFEATYVFDDKLAIKWLLEGQPNEFLKHDAALDMFTNGYPQGFSPETYTIPPLGEDQIHLLHHGDVIDLGDRKLEVLHTPGHSNDSIMLLDRANRSLFTGDTFYSSWLFAFFDEEFGDSDPEVYEETMRKIAQLEPDIDFLYCSHLKSLVTPKILPVVAEAFESVNKGEIEYELSELYGHKVRIHEFDGFSILTKAE
jgi:glyoxylase-like metal-dependent hydrolase (beta-lactamase superfamily II)